MSGKLSQTLCGSVFAKLLRLHIRLNCQRWKYLPEHLLAPCSTWGSSSGTAFSVSVPPTSRVLGMGRNDAIHQIGKTIKPTKKHQACSGDASSKSPPRCGAHPVRLILGFRGSYMEYAPEVATDGGRGLTMALMGMDPCDILRQLSRRPVKDAVRGVDCVDGRAEPG